MPNVLVIGAGTMGAGIAQVAATAGWTVRLRDVDAATAEKAIANIRRQIERLVEKERMTPQLASATTARLHVADSAAAPADCELVIEAVVEDLDVKAAVLRAALPALRQDALIATNTSSLSVTRLGEALGQAPRTVGMHFFNPVPLMPLVEVIAGRQTRPDNVDRAVQIATEWGKSPVRASDTPGFIVNRVARGYYLEAMRMLAEGVGGVDEIDATLRRMGGFRMGPFELMDLVGIDVNYAVSCSVWEQLDRPNRLLPSTLQKELLENNRLGRKTKLGWYSYQREHPVPATPVQRASFQAPEQVYQAVRMFCDKAGAPAGSFTEQYVFARTLGAVINEAALAVDDQVAEPAAIDTAMKLGTNYPKGPLEWAEQIGKPTCRFLLDSLNQQVSDRRFTPGGWLRV